MLYKPLDVSVHQGEIVPIAGPGATGKTELAIRIAADICLDSMLMNSCQSSFDVFWISVGDIFPIKRFVHILEAEYSIRHSRLSKDSPTDISKNITEEEYFLTWMKRVTDRCHVVECLDWNDVTKILNNFCTCDSFDLESTKSPLFILDCGAQSVPHMKSLLLPLERLTNFFSNSKRTSKHPFYRILQHSFPEALNKANGSGVVIIRSKRGSMIEGDPRRHNSSKAGVSSNVQIIFQESDRAIFQIDRSGSRNSAHSLSHGCGNQYESKSQVVTYEISRDKGFSVLGSESIT